MANGYKMCVGAHRAAVVVGARRRRGRAAIVYKLGRAGAHVCSACARPLPQLVHMCAPHVGGARARPRASGAAVGVAPRARQRSRAPTSGRARGPAATATPPARANLTARLNGARPLCPRAGRARALATFMARPVGHNARASPLWVGRPAQGGAWAPGARHLARLAGASSPAGQLASPPARQLAGSPACQLAGPRPGPLYGAQIGNYALNRRAPV